MLKARLFVATISMVSMVLQPLAYGQTQENWAAQALKQYVRQNQKLGKPVTVKEFWDKNKATLHPEWQKKFFPSINLQKDERLPQMEVISVKGPAGRNTARLVITLASKKTISVEFLGGQEKYVRINNQNISYADFYSGEGMMSKLSEDSVVRAEASRVQNQALKNSMVPSYQLFKKMTAQERAEYFVNLRHVIQAASEVTNQAFEASSEKESASFVKLFLEQANAQNIPKNWVGKKCIVAGYVGTYVKDTTGTYCDSTRAIKNFAALNALKGLTQNKVSASVYDKSCGAGNLRCNPFVYGYDRGSGSTCVKIDRQAGSSYQQATRTCDNASPLRKGSLVSDTEAMIKTLLGKENKDADAFFKDGKVVSEEKYNELMGTVVQDFNTFIDEAIGTCGDSKNLDGTTNFGEKYQGDACSVLKNRKLAFEEGFGLLKGKYDKPSPTPAPAPIADGETPCKMPDGSRGVKRGADCVSIVPDSVSEGEKTCGPQMEPAADANGKMGCRARSSDVADGKDEKTKRKKKDSGFDCDVICPLLVLGLFAYAAHASTESKQVNKPVDFIPPVPPGVLPGPPPQPTPITPVPEIIPTLPPPAPAVPTGSENGTVPAPEGGATGNGVR